MSVFLAYTDGASSPKLKVGGWAYCVVERKQVVKIASGGETGTTNNRMEITAFLNALEEGLKASPKTIQINSDSQYVVNAVKLDWISNWVLNGWKNANGDEVANIDLWMRVDELVRKAIQRKITLVPTWVKAHNGNKFNELVDEWAVIEKNLLINRLVRSSKIDGKLVKIK